MIIDQVNIKDLKGKKFIQYNAANNVSAINAPLPQILLIEDDRCTLFCLEAIVGRIECLITSAMDGQEALTLATSQHFDLIFTDIQLPYISGIELCQRIRNWENLNHKKPVPIIGLTGYLTDEVEHYCSLVGMDKVFTKPIVAPTIEKLINQFI